MREANSENQYDELGRSPSELTDESATSKVNHGKSQTGLKSLHSKISGLGSDLVAAKDVRIKGLGIWDAVSALGIPVPLQVPQPKGKRFRSVHAAIPKNVDHCYQALALDERRKHFKPVIWKSEYSCPPRTHMKQCWFMGTHGDVGGGNPDRIGLSNLSLIWMMAHLTKAGVDFDQKTLSAFLTPDNPSSPGPNPKAGQHSPMHHGHVADRHNEDIYQVESSKLPQREQASTQRSSPHRPPESSPRTSLSSESQLREKLSSEASDKKSFRYGKKVYY